MIICRNVSKRSYIIKLNLFTVQKCPYTIKLHLFTVLKCPYTTLTEIRNVLLYNTMALFLVFGLCLYGPCCTTSGVDVSDIGWISICA